jgi:hypothetical protein
MNNTEWLILFLVIFVFLMAATYIGSEFIVKHVDMPFILVFGIGILFPPLWLLILLYALVKSLDDSPPPRPYEEPILQPYYR